jgi:hypothetical protein
VSLGHFEVSGGSARLHPNSLIGATSYCLDDGDNENGIRKGSWHRAHVGAIIAQAAVTAANRL